MFGSLGVPELLLIFFVILIVFGPRRIPEIGRTLGKALGEFKKATDDLKNTIEKEVRLEELKQVMPNAVTPFESVSRSEPAIEPSPGPFAEPPAGQFPALQVVESTVESTVEPTSVPPADPPAAAQPKDPETETAG